jgi:outer membrane protein
LLKKQNKTSKFAQKSQKHKSLKNSTKYILLANSILILFILLFIGYSHFFGSNIKVVYVDNVKLFDGFNMTKEMKRVGEKQFNSRKTALDSLYARLQSPTISEKDKKTLMPQFIQGKQELEQFNQNFANVEVTKIWSRIHDYTAEFSEQNRYKLILGSDSKQSVLFAHDDVNITAELLLFINRKYEGEVVK